MGIVGRTASDYDGGVGTYGLDGGNTVGMFEGNGDPISSAPTGLYDGTNSIKITSTSTNGDEWGYAFDDDSDQGIFGKKTDGVIKFRIIGRNTIGGDTNYGFGADGVSYERKSEWRKLSSAHHTDGGDYVQINWNRAFLPDDVNHYKFWWRIEEYGKLYGLV